jgi:peptidoglycan-associated lipoprotein
MRTTARILSILLGVAFVLTMVGCPKKVVQKEEPIPPPPPPQVEEPVVETPKMEWNLATIHFDFDKSDIRTGDATILQGNHDQIKRALGMNMKPAVTVEGYCDPIGTSEYNMALGMRRAESAKAYMVQLGAEAAMFSTISYGEEKLVTQDEAQYEQNRRCEFKVAE